MKALAVIGMGLVSPLGLTPEEHAFFVRAGVGPQAPGAFRDKHGDPIPAAYCAFLGAALPVGDRLRALGALAHATATEGWQERAALVQKNGARAPGPVFVVTGAPRTGLAEADRRAIEVGVGEAAGRRPERFTGEAGFFAALARAAEHLEQRAESAAVIVAADSFIAPAALEEWRRMGTTPWESDLPRPAEAAAAVLVMLPDEAQRVGIEVLATVAASATKMGAANDDNDEIVDGAALTALVRALPALGEPFGASFGQHGGSGLRRREWEMAAARNASRFDPTCAYVCLESKVGSFGAAAGAAALVHGIAVHRHRAWPEEPRDAAPFVAWAISRDGTRGICAARTGM
ncbi:hypothetical protein [Polyangium aurulentum]|uniref:hypothetical protein n=1 Tax=Polyangium aurulentum TaxID=2567896 RepID=UPI0010ADD0C6|nr:hypothetical protein [Polyangium aurulentum]UQA63182.1 hypothetical protein E8A73_023040 [Polyangium aurulentum]